jgi:predicted protein tyrosine phosphatase
MNINANVSVINSKTSESIIPLENTIIIRITSNEKFSYMANEKLFSDILELRFDDVSDTHPTGDTMLYGQMTNDHYNQIVSFFEKNKLDTKNIIVHCDAGQSRSPAVALGILDYLLEDPEQAISLIRINGHWKPNIHVLSYFKKAYWLS